MKNRSVSELLISYWSVSASAGRNLTLCSLLTGILCNILPLAFVCIFAGGADAVEADGCWARSVEALNATTPYSLASSENKEKGWSQGSWEGIKRIWFDGNSDLYLSGYYWHTPLGFSREERAKYDDLGLGAGCGRSLTDERGNLRLLYAMIVQDSFEKPMYLAGYGWLARWKLPEDFYTSAGYSVVILSNSIASGYIPFPAPAPLVSFGKADFTVFGTFFNSILYFFIKIDI